MPVPDLPLPAWYGISLSLVAGYLLSAFIRRKYTAWRRSRTRYPYVSCLRRVLFGPLISRFTLFQGFACSLFLAGNAVLAGFPFPHEDRRHTAAVVGIINLSIAFLTARPYMTSWLLSPRSSDLFHSCFVLAGVIHTFTHASIPGGDVTNAIRISGWTAAGWVVVNVIASVVRIRLDPPEALLQICGISLLISLMCHIAFLREHLTSQLWFLAAPCCVLVAWVVFAARRIHRYKIVNVISSEGAVARVDMPLGMDLLPGQHLKLLVAEGADSGNVGWVGFFLRKAHLAWNLFIRRRHPVSCAYWDEVAIDDVRKLHQEQDRGEKGRKGGQRSEGDRGSEEIPKPDSLYFLLPESCYLEPNRRVYLGGPYGAAMRSHDDYVFVVLAGEGPAIPVLLQIAHFIGRKQRQERRTRRINFFWKLDHNAQLDLVVRQLNGLVSLDREKRLISGTIAHPGVEKPEWEIPSEVEHWSFVHWNEPKEKERVKTYQNPAKDRLERIIHQRSTDRRGHTLVIVCGRARFSQSVKRYALSLPDMVDVSEVDVRLPGPARRVTKRDIQHVGRMV